MEEQFTKNNFKSEMSLYHGAKTTAKVGLESSEDFWEQVCIHQGSV